MEHARSAARHIALGWLAGAVALLLLGLITGCDIDVSIDDDDSNAIAGSGDLVTREFDFANFDRVDVSNAFVVVVQQSDEFSISVTADDNLMPLVEVKVSGDALHLRLAPRTSVRSPHTLEATITMPALRGVELSGASRFEFIGFTETTPLDFDLSGASFVEGELNGEAVTIELSGASRAELTGTALRLTLEGSGASRAELDGLAVERVTEVDLSGASFAALTVSGEMEQVDLSGASTLEYRGNPTLGDVETSGGSSLRHR
jgi:uncharacterized protein YjbI with pentapeptide repeats